MLTIKRPFASVSSWMSFKLAAGQTFPATKARAVDNFLVVFATGDRNTGGVSYRTDAHLLSTRVTAGSSQAVDCFLMRPQISWFLKLLAQWAQMKGLLALWCFRESNHRKDFEQTSQVNSWEMTCHKNLPTGTWTSLSAVASPASGESITFSGTKRMCSSRSLFF